MTFQRDFWFILTGMPSLLLISTTPNSTENFDSAVCCWKTCLRSVYFFESGQVERSLTMEIYKEKTYRDEGAYRFLLEVICGLKSEIPGETQVFGQFKAFLAEIEHKNRTFYLKHSTLFQSLLQDCKEIREKFIQKWGGSSYGSLSRKLVDATTRAYVLGNGGFSESIKPWISNISVIARNPKNETELSLTNHNFVKINTHQSSLIIAAPISNLQLISLLSIECTDLKFKTIIDWRAEEDLKHLDLTEYFSFSDLNLMMHEERKNRASSVEIVADYISSKVESWFNRKIFRPLGWEDLCS